MQCSSQPGSQRQIGNYLGIERGKPVFGLEKDVSLSFRAGADKQI